MMTLHRLGAGDGYRYLTDQVASHDGERQPGERLTDYYTQTGNPAGRWMGTGADVMGVTGEVRTAQMHRLYGLGQHPETGAQLGRRFAIYKTAAQRVRDRLDAAAEAGRPLSEHDTAVAEREEAAKGESQAVSGFDHVFSPVKSVSLAWALAQDPGVREQVEAAHHAAVAHTVRWIETDAARTRTGAGGVAQVDVVGVTVAAFDHRTSRAGDPDLHTHAVISNKVLARLPGGGTRWLTLDSTAVHKAAVAASERYNRTLEDELGRRLGWGFAARDDQDAADPTAIREVEGVPLDLIRGFSSRRLQIETAYDRLVADYHAQHGHTPPKTEQYALAQQATLAQRPPKELRETPHEERVRWAAQAQSLLGEQRWVALSGSLSAGGLRPLSMLRDVADAQVTAWAEATVADVTARRSTWTVRHVQAAAFRATRDITMVSDEARDALVARVVDRVLCTVEGGSAVVQLDPPEMTEVPVELRRLSGDSVFVAHASSRYTTRRQLESEDRLLEHARTLDAPRADAFAVHAAAERAAEVGGHPLTSDQLDAVANLAGSRRRVGLLIGPAGTGKTTTVRGLVDAWRAGDTGRVWGLAPTAVAAGILAQETGLDGSDTMAMHARGGSDITIGAGDLVVVDEAGMAGTASLLALVDEAAGVGAKVVLVGDHRQLGAIESGGALRLLSTDVPDAVAELTSVWRFSDRTPDGGREVRTWEAEASLDLRRGRPDAVEAYISHGRVGSGAAAVLADDLYDRWMADEQAGRTAVMIAGTQRVIADLGRRARADLVAAGQVEPGGVDLADGTVAGVGDVVVTRRNDRKLRAGREFVRNGDLWRVESRDDRGALRLRHVTHGGVLDAPPAYVRDHVEQGYAMTVHRAQGSTVDAAHVLVDQTWSRELLYVAMTRGREANRAYVVTEHLLGAELERPAEPEQLARQVLGAVLARESADLPATEVLRESFDRVDDMSRLLPRFRYAAELAAGGGARDVVASAMSPDLAERVTGSPAWGALALRITMLEHRAVDVREALSTTLADRSLDGAEDAAAVLHARLDDVVVGSRPSGGDWLPVAPDGHGDLGRYMREVRQSMEARAEHLGVAAAADSPDWAAGLPPVPAEQHERLQWETLAGRVAAYREAYGVDGVDPLGPVPREPLQAEQHDQLRAAVDQAVRIAELRGDGGPHGDDLAGRLAAARERADTALAQWQAHERAGQAGVRDGDVVRDRLQTAETTLRRLDEADVAWHRWESAVDAHARAEGVAMSATMGASGLRGGAGRRAAADAERLTAQAAAARVERDAAAEAWAGAGRGLPATEAWPAARRDAEQTVATRAELLARAADADRAGAATWAARRTALQAAYRESQERLAELRARAEALGVAEQQRRAPALAFDAGREEPDDDRVLGDDGYDR